MPPSRVYVPSVAVLRALSRSASPRCPVSLRISAQCVRRKTTKATSTKPVPPSTSQKHKKPRKNHRPVFDGVPIEFWEKDIHGLSPDRKVGGITKQEDIQRIQETWAMIEKKKSDPSVDEDDLRRRMLDDMIHDPEYEDIKDELKSLKELQQTPEERAKMEKELEPEVQEIASTEMMHTWQSLQDLIDDPELAEAREDLIKVQAKLPSWNGEEDPELDALLERCDKILGESAAFQKKVAAKLADGGMDMPEFEQYLAEYEKEAFPERDDKFDPEEGIDLDEFEKDIEDMEEDEQAVLKEILAEMRQAAAEDAEEDEKGGEDDDDAIWRAVDKQRQKDIEAVLKAKAAQDLPPQKLTEEEKAMDAEFEALDPTTKAEVERIMQNPKLLQRVQMVKEVLDQHRKRDDLTRVDKSAPDPSKLPKARLTTVQEQLKAAMQDPEHIAGIRRTQVNLLPPFNMAPAVRQLNEALKLAYCGANDDIRRILWRCYIKARTVPTLLPAVPDDAWDLLWYSQAVTWKGNQNRQAHLDFLLKDMDSVGRDGPPTKPEMLNEDDP